LPEYSELAENMTEALCSGKGPDKEWLLTPEQETEARREAEARAQALEAEVARLREELARRSG
jgi:hypothetical protein